MKKKIALCLLLVGLMVLPAAALAGRHGGHGGRGHDRGRHYGAVHHHHHGCRDRCCGWYGAAALFGTVAAVDALYGSRACGGYWHVERVWIPPVTERTWCRSCYTEYTDLGPGCWQEVVVRPGYYENRRVWVTSR